MELSLSCHHPGCDAKCANFRDLQDHLKTHLGYRCHHPNCGQAFESFDGLKTHITTHQDDWVEQEWGDLDLNEDPSKKKKKKGSKQSYQSLQTTNQGLPQATRRCCCFSSAPKYNTTATTNNNNNNLDGELYQEDPNGSKQIATFKAAGSTQKEAVV
jgi:hypothetical protein